MSLLKSLIPAKTKANYIVSQVEAALAYTRALASYLQGAQDGC